MTDRRYEPARDVLYRELDDEAILLHLESGEYYGLDGTGPHLWRLLAARRSVDEVVAVLLAEYDVPEDRLRRDLDELIGELVSRDLLRPVAEERG